MHIFCSFAYEGVPESTVFTYLTRRTYVGCRQRQIRIIIGHLFYYMIIDHHVNGAFFNILSCELTSWTHTQVTQKKRRLNDNLLQNEDLCDEPDERFGENDFIVPADAPDNDDISKQSE